MSADQNFCDECGRWTGASPCYCQDDECHHGVGFDVPCYECEQEEADQYDPRDYNPESDPKKYDQGGEK